MRTMRPSVLAVAGAVAILALIAVSPAFAADPVQGPIHRGVDLWMTVAGFAKTSFAEEPIPAGFFCEGSRAFTGAVTFQGVPIAMEPARSLGAIDTVVRRLDDATFDAKGEATTRIQLLALSLASVQPIETSCGKYDVAVRLAGEQPVTTMRIFRSEPLGGTYSAPLALNVQAVFTPVAGNAHPRRQLARRITLGPGSHSVWTYVNTSQYKFGVKIDTDGDGKPDTVLPPSSNFLAGVEPAVFKHPPTRPQWVYSEDPGPVPCCPSPLCPYKSCHCDPDSTDPHNPATDCDHLHCIWTCIQYENQGCDCALAPPPP